MRGFYCAFEGIDGSGKTALASRVARELGRLDVPVQALRPEGRYRDGVAEALRDVGRDPHNLCLDPVAELLVYAAREAQLMRRHVLPSLERGEIVVADRSPATLLAMCNVGRGLDRAEVEAVARVAGRGRVPDLTILLDVDLPTSRLRKAVAGSSLPDDDVGRFDFGRKGLSGLGLRKRMAEAYREMAAAEPERWLVLDNRRTSFEDLVQSAMVGILSSLRAAGIDAGRDAATGAPSSSASREQGSTAPRAPVEQLAQLAGPESTSADVHPEGSPRGRALERWLLEVAREEGQREPGLAAMLLSSLHSEASMRVREELARQAPAAVALSLAGVPGPGAERLRDIVQEQAPRAVARSLHGLTGAEHDRRREALAQRAPRQTLLSLGSRTDDLARGLRRSWGAAHTDILCRGLAGRDDEEAWELRARHAGEHPEAVLWGLAGVGGAASWQLRESLGAGREVWMLASVAGLDDEPSWELRERLGSFAPKVLALGLRGLEGPRAWAARHRFLVEAKEVVDSIAGMTGPDAAELRECARDVWPSTVVSSLASRASDSASWELRWAQLLRHPEDLILAKHVVRAGEVWCSSESDPGDEDDLDDT